MTTHIRRREFIATLGSAAAWPFGARAQQRSMPTIGLLHSGSLGGWTSMVAAFREGLNDAGYAGGGTWRSNFAGPKEIMIDCRFLRLTL